MKEVNGTAPEIKPYTVKQLAEIYGVSPHTFKGWVDEISEKVGHKRGHHFTIKQVIILFDELGVPPPPPAPAKKKTDQVTAA